MYNFKNTIFAALLIFVAVNCSSQTKTENQDLIFLKNENIEVGILPEVGGRVVLLRIPGYKNIFKSDSSLWENPASKKPEISPDAGFKAFNGHIVWVGPQKEWWSNQNLNPERKEQKANWPPDPYIIYSKFEIVEQTDSSIKMVGPESPISGVKLYKEISIEKSGIVNFSATIENITDSTIYKDIWMNTRFNGFAKPFVPINKDGINRFIYNENSEQDTIPYTVKNNLFSLEPYEPKLKRDEQVQEVHLNPSDNYMAAVDKGQILIINFKNEADEKVHPAHGKVELYNCIYLDKTQNLLELEMHSGYKALNAGEKMSLSESWKVYELNKIDTLKKGYINIFEIINNLK